MVFKDKLTNFDLWLFQILTVSQLCRLGPVGGFHLLIWSACLLSAPQPRERPRRLAVSMGLSARAESNVRKMEMIKHLGRGLTRSV